jgi:hypothetical protein
MVEATRQNLVLGSLFALAFALVLAVGREGHQDGASDIAASRSVAGPLVPKVSPVNDDQSNARRAVTEPTAPVRRTTALHADQTRADALDPTQQPTAEQLDAVAQVTRELSSEETTAEEDEQRGNAIRELGKAPGPQAVQTLAYALRSDSDPRNRILAIEALRRAAAAGDDDGAIRNALRQAAASEDETVANHAREVYDGLIPQLGQ